MLDLHLYDESSRSSSNVRLEEERRRNSLRKGPTGHKSDAALPPQAALLESNPHDSVYLVQTCPDLINDRDSRINENHFYSSHPNASLLLAELATHSLRARLTIAEARNELGCGASASSNLVEAEDEATGIALNKCTGDLRCLHLLPRRRLSPA